MQPFELVEPRSLDEALAIVGQDPDARPFAGGTALVIMLKQGLLRPERLVNLKKVAGLRGIVRTEDGGLRIGALTTIGEVAAADAVRGPYPALAHACHVVANVRIRNMATVGGNVSHGDYQSDPPAMLVALDAQVRVRSKDGERTEPLRSFLVAGYTTTLRPGELVTEILVPRLSGGYSMGYEKFTTRSEEDRPCAGVAVAMRLRDERVDDLRVVVGAVSPAPVRVEDGEGLARGERMTEALADAIGERAAAAVEPIGDLRGSADYKRRIVRVLVRRALLGVATGRAVPA